MTERFTREQRRASGPPASWGAWRERRNKAIASPRRCKAAEKLTQPKKDPPT